LRITTRFNFRIGDNPTGTAEKRTVAARSTGGLTGSVDSRAVFLFTTTGYLTVEGRNSRVVEFTVDLL
jgi:hypothetical protein